MLAAFTTVLLMTQAPTPPAQGASPQRPAAPRADAVPDDIIVEGYRERPDIETTVTPAGNVSGRISRTKYEYSERIARCAARSRLSDLSRLRAVVDGEVNTANYRTAQDRLVRINITCGESPTLLSFTAPPQGALDLGFNGFDGPDRLAGITGAPGAAPLGWSIYDRGAFTIQALKFFAPDLTLTRKETGDQAALIDRARVCVGNAKNVRVDPTQFRLYIADAVYRWAVAARGVDTLIPDTAARVTPAGSSPS